jgi:hypothetical protein
MGEEISVTKSIILGVVSGIVTSFILALVLRIYTKILKPWFEELLYKGVDIDGKWATTHVTPSTTYHLTLHVDQKANKLSGTYYEKCVHGSEETSAEHSITGTLVNNYIIINFSPISRKIIAPGTMLLKIMDGGSSLHGDILYINELGTDIWYLKGIKFKRQ